MTRRRAGRADPGEQKCRWCDGSKRQRVTHNGTGEVHGMPCACAHELPIPFIYQADDGCGCGIAAIAMATRSSYADVRKMLVMSTDLSGHTIGAGVGIDQADDIVADLGFAWQTKYEHCQRLEVKRDPWPCAPWADTHLVHVRNLSDNGDHYVCWLRDGRVLDPWWGVISGLHRYPHVYSIKGLFRVREVTR